MRILRAALVVAAALALTACTAVATGTPAGSPTPSASTAPSSTPAPEPTPTTAAATALVLSLDSIGTVDGAGNTITSATLSEGAAVEALLTTALGTPSEKSTTKVAWDGVAISVNTDTHQSRVHLLAATSAGIALRSAAGVSVGMTRDQAIAAGLTADSSFTDTNTNVLNERFISEKRPVAGTTSLSHLGETGSDFVDYAVVGGVVTSIIAPGNDYADI